MFRRAKKFLEENTRTLEHTCSYSKGITITRDNWGDPWRANFFKTLHIHLGRHEIAIKLWKRNK